MDTNNQKLIDRFLLGELNANEEAKFLEQLENDQAFKSLFESSKAEFQHMDFIVEGDLRNQMDEWDKEDKVDPVQLPAKKFQLGNLIIATVALIAIALISFYVLKPKADPIMMAEAYYNPDFSTVRSADSDAFDDVKFILEGRKESAYATLKETLAQISASSENYSKAQYYLGHIAYFEKDFNKAQQYFALVDKASDLKAKADWYEALSMIQLGNEVDYIEALKHLGRLDGHEFQARAQALLSELQQ